MEQTWTTEGEADSRGATVGTMGATVFGILKLPVYPKDLKSTLRMIQLRAHEWADTFDNKEENKERMSKDDTESSASAHENKDGLKIISRKQWKGKTPVTELHPRIIPFQVVLISVALYREILSLDNCSILLQQWQREATHNDERISNFVVGPDGFVYEGLGWDCYQKSDQVLLIRFAVRNIEEAPSRKGITACKMLIQKGVSLGKIVPFYSLTSNPFARITEEIVKWENYTNIHI